MLRAATAWIFATRTPSRPPRRMSTDDRTLLRRVTSILERGFQVALRRAGSAVPADTGGYAPREREIMSLLAAGFSYKEIAAALSLSYGAVHGTIKSLYRRHGAHSKVELVARLRRP